MKSSLDATATQIYEKIAATMPDNPILSGKKIYSQCDEDGIIGHILDKINSLTPLTRSFIEFGSANGLENNTHVLLLNNYSGCWIEGASEHTAYIEQELGSLSLPRLLVLNEQATLENIRLLAEQCVEFLGTENLDFLSMDLDGNDYHFMRELMAIVNPKLVCVEYNGKFPPPMYRIMEYKAEHRWTSNDYFGASLQAWVDFFTNHTLVCCNLTGANAFFVRNDLCSTFTLYPTAELYQPPRYALAGISSGHTPSLSWLRQNQKKTLYATDGMTYGKLPGLREFSVFVHTKPDEFITPALLKEHVWEEFETSLFLKLLEREDIVLDIGANLGWYASVTAMGIGNAGHIHAFEPDPDNFSVLEKNAEAMRNFTGHAISTYNCAVGSKSTHGKLFLAAANLGDHRVFPGPEVRESLNITIQSLDDLFYNQSQRPTIVKLDVQGSEAAVLEGAMRLFNSGWRPVVFFEFWPFGLRNAGDDAYSLWKFFEDLKYAMFEVCVNTATLRELTEEYVQKRLDDPVMKEGEHFMDIVAIPSGSGRMIAIEHLVES
jgi:FkbM family methyltransferase